MRIDTVREAKGFTLVEIMIVVAIIGVLVSMALPNLLRMRINAIEAKVKGDLRSFSSACEIYRAAQNPPMYPEDVEDMTEAGPPYLDITWNEDTRNEFEYTYAVGDARLSFSMLAVPSDDTGINTYCMDQSGMIVSSVNGEDPPEGGEDGCEGGTVIQ